MRTRKARCLPPCTPPARPLDSLPALTPAHRPCRRVGRSALLPIAAAAHVDEAAADAALKLKVAVCFVCGSTVCAARLRRHGAPCWRGFSGVRSVAIDRYVRLHARGSDRGGTDRRRVAVGACVAKVELFISALPDGVDQPVLRTPVTRVPCGVEAAAAELERYNEEASALAQSIAASCAGCGMQLSTCVPPRRPQPLPVRVGADRAAAFVRSRAQTRLGELRCMPITAGWCHAVRYAQVCIRDARAREPVWPHQAAAAVVQHLHVDSQPSSARVNEPAVVSHL